MNDDISFKDPTPGTNAHQGLGWLLPLLLIVFLAGFVLYFVYGGHNTAPVIAQQFIAASDTGSPQKQPVVVKVSNPLKHEVELQLPDTTLMVDKGSMEYRFAMYIASPKPSAPSQKPPVIPTFDFDGVSFKNTTAILNPQSATQLQKVATIIREYPDVQIRIGCFANDTDNDAANLELSKQRANVVTNELVNRGVKQRQILASQGHGTSKSPAGGEVGVRRTGVFLQVLSR